MNIRKIESHSPKKSYLLLSWHYTLLVFLTLLFNSCGADKSNLTDSSEDWIPLFNGKDLSDWDIKIAGYKLNDNYKNTFVAEDSMIRIKYDAYDTFNDAFGHMYYKQPFSYYKLRFKYRFIGEQLDGGASWNVRNSGVMLHSQSALSNELGQGFPVSVEMQLLGGLDQGERTTGNVCTPGTAVEMKGVPNYDHCISSTSKTFHGNQWVRAEAVVLGGKRMYFIIEQDTVLSFENPQIGGGFISKEQEGKDWDAFHIERDKASWLAREGEILKEGYIALQAESHPIDFKEIALLNLCGCMDPKAKNFKPYYIKNTPEKCLY